jgi:hypothetical protein
VKVTIAAIRAHSNLISVLSMVLFFISAVSCHMASILTTPLIEEDFQDPNTCEAFVYRLGAWIFQTLFVTLLAGLLFRQARKRRPDALSEAVILIPVLVGVIFMIFYLILTPFVALCYLTS